MSPRPSRRGALRLVGLVSALLLASCGDGGRSRRPDVVLVVVDTLRRDRLSCYGYPRPTSPFLDERAHRGVIFEDVTPQAPWTLPSMVSMMQGHYLTDYRDALDPELPALAESFQKAGYRTVALVSNCAIGSANGFDRGFDFFDTVECWEEGGEGEPGHEHAAPHEKQVRVRGFDEMCDDLRSPLANALEPDPSGERPPLFLYLHAYDTHSPYRHHEEMDGELPLGQSMPIRPPGWQRGELARLGPPAPEPNGWKHDLQEIRRERGQYDQEVLALDRGLRRLDGDLRSAGLDPDAAVWALVADHGECLWEHLSPFSKEVLAQSPPKSFFYQKHGAIGCGGILDTPFLVWGAGVPEGERVSAPVENVDLFPTLLQLADVAPPQGLSGKSLVPLMHGELPSDWRRYTFTFGEHASAVREAETGLKLELLGGRSSGSEHTVLLFDVRDDPDERRDLAEARPEDAKRLSEVFGEWLKRYPTRSNLNVSDAKAAELRAQLMKKLSGLGYTGLDTGLDLETKQ